MTSTPVAVLHDLHGNVHATRAALDDAWRAGARRVLIGGDVAYGPHVRETLDLLLGLGEHAVWIRGNADRELVSVALGTPPDGLPDDLVEAMRWEAAHLTNAHLRHLEGLGHRRTLCLGELGDVLLCHATPRADDEIVTALTPGDVLAEVLAGVGQDLVVGGHTHVPLDRHAGQVRFVNPGSVGLPYDGPGAAWALLDGGVRFMRAHYDVRSAADEAARSGHPLAADLAATLLQPPGGDAATAHFEDVARARRKT
ncbi:metallophosphoesterase family protein [Deinococcus pimensis]|uniref:metallophosphoesterase family protein n=1 Tax=Deinococcus pimensis TaxID=309888 RepID=UPI0005EBD09A|nr:metallophosphoesterase family protein [Deinococcus pimensis]